CHQSGPKARAMRSIWASPRNLHGRCGIPGTCRPKSGTVERWARTPMRTWAWAFPTTPTWGKFGLNERRRRSRPLLRRTFRPFWKRPRSISRLRDIDYLIVFKLPWDKWAMAERDRLLIGQFFHVTGQFLGGHILRVKT
ncbi:unnamed protein product, partial [Durusdinium trenchii]